MNKIFRVIWNGTLGRWVVASELGRGKMKSAENKNHANLNGFSEKMNGQSGILPSFSPMARGIKAILFGCPMLLGFSDITEVKAETQIQNSVVPVFLTDLKPETDFFVASGSTLTAKTNSTIYGNKTANWHVTNYGTIVDNTGGVTGLAGVQLDSLTPAGSRVDNYGIISQTVAGAGGAGVRLDNGGTVVNHAGAQINAAGTYGILSAGTGILTLINDGTIYGSSGGMRLVSGANITQSATGAITANSGAIIVDGGALSITNAGLIQGTSGGLVLRGNSGGVVNNSGTISGPTAVALQGTTPIVLTNSGTLNGTGGTAINMSSNNNQIILETGSILKGNVTSTGSNNSLELKGTGSASGNITGVSTITAKDSGTWTLGGTVNTNAASESALLVENGKLIVTGNVSNSGSGAGATVANGGTLQIGDGNSSGSVTSDISVGDNSQLVFNRSNNLAYSASVSGTGTLVKSNLNLLELRGNNSYSGGTIINGGTLRVAEGGSLGDGNVLNNGALEFAASSPTTVSNVISGAGSFAQVGSGRITLGAANTYAGSTKINSGQLAISADNNLGDGSASNSLILNGGDLAITGTLSSARTAQLAESGSILVDKDAVASLKGWSDMGDSTHALTKAGEGTLLFTGDNTANTADVHIVDGVLSASSLDQIASREGVLDLAAKGTLALNANADTLFTRQLQGSGKLQVNLGDSTNAFTFTDSAAGGNFIGTVSLNAAQMKLDASQAGVMHDATLQLNNQAESELSGEQILHGLDLNGGKLTVGYSSLDNRPLGHLAVDSLDVSGGGTLQIDLPENIANPQPDSGTSLFDQVTEVYDQIVSALNVTGAGSQVAFTHTDGSAIGDDTVRGLEQDGSRVADAHYNYTGVVQNDGLYVGYALTKIDALNGQTVVLDNSHAQNNTLGAILSGEGGFAINATGTVGIGNAASNYTGATTLTGGNVELLTDNALGQTSSLTMQADSSLNLQGNQQKVGSLATEVGSVIKLDGGALTLGDGGKLQGEIQGEGELNLTHDTLTITSDNNDFSGTTNIASDAKAIISQLHGLGSGAIVADGTLEMQGMQGELANNLSGALGHVALTQGTDLGFSGNNESFTGTVDISDDSTLTASTSSQIGNAALNNQGHLVLDTSDKWVFDNALTGEGSLVKKGQGTVEMNSNAVAGNTLIEEGTLLIGGAQNLSTAVLTSDVNVGQQGVLAGYGSVKGKVTNAGNLLVGQASGGENHGDFTIHGDYEGQGGTVKFNTDLGDDNSATDKLIITGSTSGASNVVVQSAHGEGAQTAEGIRLIDVKGSSSAGAFTLKGRAVAGPYEYFLHQGKASNPADGNWYLRSSQEDSDNSGGNNNTDNSGGNNNTDNSNTDNGGKSNPEYAPILRPEAGGYLANMSAAQNMFNLRLNDREGRAENSSLWLRQSGSRTGSRDNSGQIHNTSNSYVVQGGGEIWNGALGDSDRLGVGVMAGYGNSDNHSWSALTGYNSRGTVDGYSAGMYATWYQDAKQQQGLYADSWLQYSWLNANEQGDQRAAEHYGINGFSASIESGYRLPVYHGTASDVYITPQAQVIWDGQKADEFYDSSNTHVQSGGNDAIKTRAGVRVSRDSVSSADKGRDKLFTVYSEVNWLYSTKNPGVAMDGITVSQAGSQNVGEIKVGAEGKLNKNLNLWANMGQQIGDKGYSDSRVTLGVKYDF